MEKFIKKIKDKKDLTFEESRSAFEFLMEGNAKEEEIYDFLTFFNISKNSKMLNLGKI